MEIEEFKLNDITVELDDKSVLQNKLMGKQMDNPDLVDANFISQVVVSATTCDHYMRIKVNGKSYKVPLTAI
jgi:hypothetical protein